MNSLWIIFVVFTSLGIQWTEGHGFLRKPLPRNAIHLEYQLQDFKPNYNLNQQNCGGTSHQWNINQGKCGVCGDPYDESKKPHEYNGYYSKGIITAAYEEGAIIPVTVTITSHHKGYFHFRVAKAVQGREVTQEELNKHLLKVIDDQGKESDRYELPPDSTNGDFKIRVILPKGFSCDHCVFQWWWICGNSWKCQIKGDCTGTENFVNCADIKINPGNGVPAEGKTTEKPTTVPTTDKSPTATTTIPTPIITTTTTEKVGLRLKCEGALLYKSVPGMADWCQNNCVRGYCPKSHCLCKPDE